MTSFIFAANEGSTAPVKKPVKRKTRKVTPKPRSGTDAHYLHRDPELARGGIRKLESRTKTATDSPD
jgi:hypothetical protein